MVASKVTQDVAFFQGVVVPNVRTNHMLFTFGEVILSKIFSERIFVTERIKRKNAIQPA